MTRTAEPVVFDPYDYATQNDPYPTYAWLRDNAPLYHNPEYGFWALSRHADVTAALRDERTFSNRMGVSIDPASWGPHARTVMSFLAMDPPEQTRLRSLVITAFLLLMIVAGNETTTKLLGNCMYWARRNRGELGKVLADPGRIPDWVDESLRYDGSTQLLARLLVRDVALHGEVAPAGSQLVLLLGAANRDERAFTDPDRFGIDRDASAVVSFGGGRHYCLGANLARLEARVALEELLARVSDYEIDEAGAERVHSINVRGFAHLPMTVTTR